MDIVRDPRWGRVVESYGEDPFLSSVFAKAAIRGFQGDDPSAPDRILACAKHFAGYGGAEGGRDYDTTEWSENTLHNMILPPFRSAAQAGVASFMTGFNDMGGTPVSSNMALIRKWLKEELDWDGFVVSDWGSIYELIGHGVAADEREAARLAFTAGIDMEMTAGFYERNIASLIDSGLISEKMLDDAVTRILRAKFRAGLFENPYTDPARSAKIMRHPKHIALAEELAAQCIVLLKNDGILPLAADLKSIAIIGPYAQARREHLCSWCVDGRPEDVATIVEAFRKEAENIEINTANDAFSDSCIDAARKSMLAVVCVGESHLWNGENHSVAELALPPGQEALIEAVGALQIPLVVVNCSGRYLPIPAAEKYADAIVHAGPLGTEAGSAIAKILLGKANPSGKLPMTIPRCTGQIPIHYNRKMPGKILSWQERYRAYEDVLKTPLYPFGFGLSYTQFQIGNIALSADSMPADGSITVSLTVKNIGAHKGAEVIQLYISDPVASTARPVRELKDFQRVELEAGEARNISFQVSAEKLSFYSAKRRIELEPGEFRAGIGTDSRVEMNLRFTVI